MANYALATYESDAGPRAAVVIGQRLYDAASLADRAQYASVLAILAEWDDAAPWLESLAATPPSGGEALAAATLHAPVLYPGAIYCAGANYQDHMDAVAKHRGMPPQPSPREIGVGPFFFLKTPRCIVGPGAAVANESEALDFEIELAVIIGRKARRVAATDALHYVAGYTVANDLSARDRILRTKLPDMSPFKYDWGSHKNFDGACPLGPIIVPASAIGDPQALSLRTWVNEELRQDSSTGKMIFSVAEQIESLSAFNTLYPGDVILTGTPKGVGAETSNFLKKGDRIRMEIGGIGEITTMIT